MKPTRSKCVNSAGTAGVKGASRAADGSFDANGATQIAAGEAFPFSGIVWRYAARASRRDVASASAR
jgi:hypothetical protein